MRIKTARSVAIRNRKTIGGAVNARAEVYINNQKTTVNVEYFGTPFEAFGIWHINLRTGLILLLWGSVEDILLFSGIASAIVLTVMDLSDRRERERYYRDTHDK